MSRAHLEAEVCVIGAGPAGAALAARLAALGHDVLVLERAAFPRFHVGESLSPGVWPLLDVLGARDAVARAGFVTAESARVRWGAGEQLVPASGPEPGLVADRASFDALLADRARECGARVVEGRVARRPARDGDGWLVECGGERHVRAGFLVDASGRARVSGGTRERVGPATVALHALCAGTPDGPEVTRVEALAGGWLWGARLPDGTFRTMAFVDPELVRRSDPTATFRSLLSSSLFSDLDDFREVRVCDASCYFDAQPIDATRVKVGEAGFAIDPLSSTGVQTALQAGLSAAVAVHTILLGSPAAAVAYYGEHQRHSVERHAAMAAGFYADSGEHAGRPFWRARATPPPAAPAAPAPRPLASLLPARVRLARGATLEPVPCVAGDRVELRRALSHPSLARPVAYLGGGELAPLLDGLRGAESLEQAVERWSRSIPRDTAMHLAGWLARRGLLEPV